MTSIPSPAAGGTRSRAMHRKARWIILLGTVALCFFLAEILLRIAWHPVITLNVETRGPHPEYGFAPLPGTVGRFVRTEYNIGFRHSTQRMRSAKIWKAERAPGTRARILFLGDSFTYGITAEEPETFVGRLATRWPDIEMINSACTGYGQREELAVLDRLGAVLKPDITLLTYFWNDLEDIQRPEPAYAIDAGGKVRRSQPLTAPLDPLALWPAQPMSPQSKWKTCYVYQLFREASVGMRHRSLSFGVGRRAIGSEEEKERAWQLSEAHFRMLKLRADEIGTRLVVLCIPDYALVNPHAVTAGITPLHYGVQDRLRKICADSGIEYHDALPALSAAFAANGGAAGAKAKPLYYTVDRHLTPFGNEVLADCIATFLGKF